MCGASAGWRSPSDCIRWRPARNAWARSSPSGRTLRGWRSASVSCRTRRWSAAHAASARAGENLCENVQGVRGFHVDGFAQERTNHPARLCVPVPVGVEDIDAASVAVAYSTVEHMLFDNAQLEPGEWLLVHAGGSSIGTIAIRVAKSIGCTVITTVGSEDKATKAL